MTNPIIGYHFLQADMTSPNAPRTKWAIGQTRRLRGGVITPCERGFHASPTLWQALTYAPGPVACLVELSGDVTPHGNPVDKYAARSRKLVAAVNVGRELRHFAADCAEHVLWIYERDYPDDQRPRQAIEAARAFADGEIDDAAVDAAVDAARAAAWAAAGDAAWAAARAAARDAAGAAARAAARAAAWAAAGAAARDAAVDAAVDAARAAAWAAAGAAETEWQRQQFEQRFGGLFPHD